MRFSHAIFAGLLSACGTSGTSIAQEITTVGETQDKIVISSGVDILGMNGLDVVAIIPDRMLLGHITDTLLRTDRQGNPRPWLATSWKNIDPLTWELTLRKGVRFQNGEPFNAAAVKFFFETVNDAGFQSPAKGMNTWVKSVETVDEYTVRLTTQVPFPTTPGQLTTVHMVPPNYIRQVGIDGYRRKPIGTGAYKFVDFVRDDHVTLEANDDWWAGKPKIKTIVFRPIKEDSARVAALLAHEVDLVFDVPPELMPVIQAGKDVAVRRALSTRAYMLWFSTLDKTFPTNNPKVREAINYAIDRSALNDAIFAGTGAPAAWLNPNTFGFDPSLKPIPYDPARAKGLLAEAGYPNGVDFVLDTPDARFIKDKEYAQAIAGQLAKVGLRARVQPYEWSVFTKRMWSHQASAVTLMAWVDSVNDPAVQNARVLQSGSTWSQYSDPKLDDLLKRIDAEMDSEKRKALIVEEQHYMRETWPVAYLEQIGIITGVSSKLDWWQPMPNDAHRFYKLNTD